MRFQRLALSLSAALTLGLAPAAARAQVITRDPCFYRWDDCRRRDDIDLRLERERRSLDRTLQAEERAHRQAEAREAREASVRIRAETRADSRAFSARLQSDARARERANLAMDRAMDRREQAELRRLRIRPPSFHFK